MTLNPLKERNPNDDDSQEGITVAIRMRPLNNVEENNRRIWKVLPKYSSIAQTSREGKPLPERISGRTFFTFDKTFGENINNKQVYDGVAKGIVNSVVDGLNGTIFAYGQTSSGKTYTMQGAGNLEQGIGGEGGVVHMSAIDIFTQIQRKQDRNFLVRVSFLEIYNEEVRDLLGDTNQTLQIREDPRRGVFVHSHEEIVTNFDDLLKVLVYGDKSRTFASTGMNERSSRSHTILRITIESREKECGDDKEDEDNGDDIDIENRNPSSDGAVRVSTLNLVDLAGSESVRHTGATGDRQKEGGLINQSLLTLSRVIVALGVPNQMHINFRDSKLTRILQPSLSGNARMAVICCATPSELYLEETRSTLQFASRAKLVKTNAKVNEVLDERSLIRRLQKELAEARRNQNGLGQGQVRDLQAQVATAGTQALEAKEKLDRLKASILNSGYIIDHDPTVTSDSVSKNMYDLSKKRRKSDGALLIGVASPSKSNFPKIMSPKTAPRRKKSKVLQHKTLDIKQELKLVQQALAARNVFVRDLSQTINKCSEEIKNKNCDVEQMSAQNVSLNNENKKSQADITNLQGMVATLKQSLDSSIKESEYALAIKDTTIMESFEKLQETLREKENSQRDKDDFVTRLSEMEQEKILLSNQISSLENDSKKEREDYEVRNRDFGSRIAEVAKEKEELQVALKIANTQLSDTSRKVQEHVVMMEEKESLVSFLEGRQKKEKEEFDAKFQNFESVILEASKEKEVAEAALKDANNRLDETTKELQAQVATTEEKISVIMSKEGEIKNRDQQQNILDRACKEALKIITTLREEKASLESSIASLQEAASTSDGEKESNRVKLSTTGKANEILSKKLKEANDELDALRESNAQAVQKNEISIQMLQTQIAESERELDEEKSSKAKLEETLLRTQQEYKSSLISLERRLSENEDNLKSQATINLSLETKLSETQKMVINTQSSEDMLKHDLEKAVDKNAQLERDLCQSVEALEQRNQRLRNLVEEQEILVSKKNSMEAAIVCHQQNAIEMERKLVNASEQISSFQSQCQSISIEKENLSVSLERMKQELNKTLSEMSALKTGHMEVSTKLRSFEIESTSKDSNMRKLEEKANVSKEEIQKLESLIDTANSKFTEKEAQFVKLSDEKKALEIHLEEIEDINATKISSLEQLHATKDQQTKELEHQLEQIKTSVQELQICNRDLIEEKKLLETRLEETEESKSSKIMNLEQLHTSKDEETKELKGQLGETKTKIQELNDIINDLIVQKKSLEANLQEMEDINLEKLTNLEQLHATKNQETKELADQLELTKTKMQELVHTNGILIDEKKSLESNLEEMHDNDTAKISNFKQLCATKDQAAKELEGEVQQMKTKVLEMQDSLENTKSKLLERDEELNKLTEEKKSFEIQLTEARDINATTIGTLEQCLDDKNQSLKEVLEQLEQSKAHINDQQAVIETTDSKLVGQEAVMKKLIQEKEALDKHLQEVQDIHSVKVATLEQLHVDKEQASNDLKNQLEQSKAEIQELQNSLDSINSKLEQQQAESIKLVEEKKALSDHLEELEDINNAKVSTLEQLHNDKEQESQELERQLDKLKADNQELQNKLDSINSKLEQQGAELRKLTDDKATLEATIEEIEDINSVKESTLKELHAAIQEMEDISAAKDFNLEKICAEKDEAAEQFNQQVNDREEKFKILELKLKEMESSDSEKKVVIEQVEAEKEKLQTALDERKLHIGELQNRIIDLKSQIEGLSSNSEIQGNEIESLLLNLMQVTSEKQEFESSHVDLKKSCDSLSAENEIIHAKLLEADENNTEVELQLQALNIEYRLLAEKNHALEVSEQSLRKTQAENENTLAQENADLSEQIKTVFTEAKAIEEERKKLQYAYTNLESQTNSKILQLRTEIDTIESSRQEIIQSLSECEAEREDTKNELEALTSGRETLTRSLHDREAERDEAMLELKKLYDENRNLNESMSECIPKVKHEELRREISEMKNQNLELKHLLASVNDSEERLRNAVKIAEKNVVTKTTELEDAQFHISQIEKELSEFQTSGVEISKIEKSNSILVEECKNIRKEKEEIDQLLREEKEARTELQKRMGEEQRALVQDGEKRMDELRRQFEESEIKLKQSEAEGYAARQQIEELDDERNRLEEKYLEASAQLNSSDSSKHRQEAMIAELESELNRTKSDNYASKETIIDMKEKLRRSTRDSEKAMREREVAHSELSTLNRKLSSLENTNDTQEMENSKLKKKTKQFEANIVALQKELAEKENKIIMVEGKISSLKLGIAKNSESNCNSTPNGNDDSILIMKAKIEEMNDLITQKNDRIKKLEAVRLTKAKIQQIGQMKTDNTNLKKKCSNMQKEILRLQEEKSSVGTDDNMKSEIDELRFDKEAVERKLRKYATHCQRLEDDKAGVADALGSCGVTIEAHGNDVGEAIINLCDKLTTTEQALKSRKGDVSSFETENRTLQREIQELSDSQKKLKEELNLYEKEKYELETELENTKNNKRVAEELRAKLRFLEDENLQLMQDAKSSKRREQTARKEIEVLRMNIDQTSTSSDFDDFDVRQSSGDKNSFLTLSSKEDSDTTELTNLAEVCSMQNTGSELRRSTRMTRVEISKEDPELTELTKSVEASASTRRSSRRIRTEASKESSDRMDLTNLAETRASTRRSTRNTEAEASKENLDTMELTNLAEARASTRRSTRKTRVETSKEKMDTVETTNFFEEHGTKSSLRRSTRNARIAEESYTHDVSTSLRQSARKTKKRGVLSDNTNGSMNEGRRTRSTDKRQRVNALFETKHAINPTGNTPGLGESSSVETENTGECQQS